MSTLVVPILRVADARASVEWYGRIGFEKIFEHRFAEGMPAYVGIQRDDAVIHLSEHTGDSPGPSLIYVWVESIDRLAELFDATPDEMPWARDFEVTDLDDNRIRLAEARTDD